MTDELQLEDLSIKQLLQLQVRLLVDMREQLILLNDAATPEESNECEHPEEKRVSLATADDLNHWICTVCQFDSKAATMN